MPTRRRIIAFLRTYLREHGYAPAVREIMAACNVSSTSLVTYHLRRLADEGVIARDEGVTRSIRLTGLGEEDVVPKGRYVVPGDTVQVDVDGFVQHGVFVA